MRPGWDDKVLADWNGLMIAALAKAGVVFAKPAWITMARRAFAFIDGTMTVEGRLRHSYRAGHMTASATASDYANMIAAAIALHQATNDDLYLTRALEWLEVLNRHYWVADTGGYATTADDTKDVIVRMRPASDDAVPNANAVMIANLMHLFLITGDGALVERAETLQRSFAADLSRSLTQHTGFLANSIDLIAPQMVVLAGDDAGALAKRSLAVAMPSALVYRIAGDGMSKVAGLAGKSAKDGKATAYVCMGPQCSPPITDGDELVAALRAQRGTASV